MRIIEIVRRDFNHENFCKKDFCFGIFSWHEGVGNTDTDALEESHGVKPIYYLRKKGDRHDNLLLLLQDIHERSETGALPNNKEVTLSNSDSGVQSSSISDSLEENETSSGEYQELINKVKGRLK